MLFVWDWDFYCYGDDAGVDGVDIDGVDIDGDGAGDVVGGGDIYIMMMCLSVCHEKWALS